MEVIKLKQFWNKISDDELYIYGDILPNEFDFTTFERKNVAKEFAKDLNSCGENVLIHINSNGGDIFTAMAISNLIKQSPKNISISIDGICASAATLISCAGKKVCMAENALMMVHLPAVFLCDNYNAIDLAKIETALNKARDAILTTYEARTGQEILFLQKLMNEETFFSAQEAKDLNFIDEITEEIPLEVDNAQKLLIFNSLELNKKYYPKAKEKLKMENNLLEKIKNLLGGEKKSAEEIRAAEILRIKNLNQERCGNAAVNALIDCAIADGKTVSEIENYINAIKNLPAENNVADKILALIEDNINSGASEVGGSEGEIKNPKAESQIGAELIAKYL